MTISTQKLFIIIISSLIYSKNDSDYIIKQKSLLNASGLIETHRTFWDIRNNKEFENELKKITLAYSLLKKKYKEKNIDA